MANVIFRFSASVKRAVFGRVAAAFMCTVLFFFGICDNMYVWASETANYEITERQENESRGEMSVAGLIPVISIINNKAAEKELNDKIIAEFENIKSQFANKKASVEFSFDIKQYDECISILLKSIVMMNTSSIFVSSINFNAYTGETLTINSVLGSNGTKIANRTVETEINNDIDNFKSNFQGINDDHDFYIDENIVYIIFDKYEIAPGHRGVVEIPIDRSLITELNIAESDYHVRTDYLIRMVMLKQVADVFDLILTWDEKEQTVEIHSSDKKLLAKLTIGKSLYIKGRNTQVTLETAPQIENGRTFVPVSFFSEILNMSYSINNDASITISQYIKP